MTDVTLKIKKNTGGVGWPGNGWVKCKVNGQDSETYAYKFTGGNWPYNEQTGKGGPGWFEFQTGQGTQTVDITVEDSEDDDPNTTPVITAIGISYDDSPTTEDLGSGVNNPPTASATITDTDVDAESGHYNITVSDTKPDPAVTGIVCDPRWQNY